MAHPATRRMPATARNSPTPDSISCRCLLRRLRPSSIPMLRRFALATALALPAVVAAPSFAQDSAAAAPAANQQTPVQIVQGIADQLGTAIEGHRAELKQNK